MVRGRKPSRSNPVTRPASGLTSRRTGRSGSSCRRLSDGPRKPLEIEELYINSQLPISPYASGDPTYLAWGQTDLGLYGSSFVGVLGGLAEPTNVEGILRIDCRATEAFAGPSLPTYLFYNPHAEEKEVRFPVGDKAVDLYDMVQNRVVAQGVSGEAAVKLPGDAAQSSCFVPQAAKSPKKTVGPTAMTW